LTAVNVGLQVRVKFARDSLSYCRNALSHV